MIKEALLFLENISHPINFASHIVIFLGGFYVAMHSRVLPRWAVTGLWYIGLGSLLTAITYLVEWNLGQQNPLSHFNVGKVSEMIVFLLCAVMVGMLFMHTLFRDIIQRKRRQRDDITTEF